MSEIALQRISENKSTKNPILDLGRCELKGVIPIELLDCVWLEELNLSSNQISDISFCKILKQLRILNLTNNHINNISPLENLNQLQSLSLEYNLVSDVSFIENLNQLQYLNLSKNHILDYSYIKNLQNLQKLDLNNNSVQEGGFLENLIELQELNLMYNRVKNIRFLEKLNQIEVLNLSHNQISNISFSGIQLLNKLNRLQTLDLSSNQISDIEPLLPIFRKGLKISLLYSEDCSVGLMNNPIQNPPIEIVKQGTDAVLRYFERIMLEGKDFIYEAKLILVGDGGSGKTSLQRRILDTNTELPAGDDRTRGIKVFDWEFTDNKTKKYITHIWDFGGQDVYYPVHRFFLTENAVYLLMASTRFQNHNFEYWIPTIYQFGGKSPIILVQNCDNGNQKNWEDVNIFYSNSAFNLCKPHYKIDLPNQNFGLDKLKNFIQQQITALPHIGKAVPKSWVKVREVLMEEVKTNSCISFEKFSDLCRKVDKKVFNKSIDVYDLGRFLHDLGIILWYYKQESLKNLVILKPEWAMNAVYKIIDDGEIQNQYGIIYQKDFERLWYESHYKERIEQLKVMLEVFKIAFPKKHQKQNYIIPARLSVITEDNRWKNDDKYLRLEYHFDFMPRGIVNQISAELSKYIFSDESVWNNAVIFKNNDSEAQMIEEYHNKKIFVKTKGKDARGLMLLIMNAATNIINEYSGVLPLLIVPCNCAKCQSLDKPTIFEYVELTEYSNEKRETVTCNKTDTKLNIFELLYSIGLEKGETIEISNKQIQENMKKEDKNEIPEIFFSYAWDKAGDSTSREKIVNDLYESLELDGYNVFIDKDHIDYKGSIIEFMQKLGAGDFIVVAISDAYLKSINCMFEFYEIFKNSKLNKELLRQKIYPIRVESLNLNKPSVLESYFGYWENLEKEWEELIKNRGTRIGESQQRKYKRIKAIASELGDFLDFLSDINSKTKEELSKDNFAEIKKAIEDRTN